MGRDCFVFVEVDDPADTYQTGLMELVVHLEMVVYYVLDVMAVGLEASARKDFVKRWLKLTETIRCVLNTGLMPFA